jgi:hypothetical protein
MSFLQRETLEYRRNTVSWRSLRNIESRLQAQEDEQALTTVYAQDWYALLRFTCFVTDELISVAVLS